MARVSAASPRAAPQSIILQLPLNTLLHHRVPVQCHIQAPILRLVGGIVRGALPGLGPGIIRILGIPAGNHVVLLHPAHRPPQLEEGETGRRIHGCLAGREALLDNFFHPGKER